MDPLSDALINKGDSGNGITRGEGTGDGLRLAYAPKKIKDLAQFVHNCILGERPID